jgi:hypothetical protein
MHKINLHSDIIPGKSAAGLDLGINFSEINDLITNPIQWKREDGQVQSVILNESGWIFVPTRTNNASPDSPLTNGRYYYNFGSIELNFNSSGDLVLIALSNKYQGLFLNSIGIGDKLAKVEDFFKLTYDDIEELHYPSVNSEISGIIFQAEECSLEESPNQDIYRIIVERSI